jgi:LysM repeat protein
VEAAAGTASVETKETDPVLPAPVHGPKPVAAKPAASGASTYTVVSGDNLTKIAKANGTTVAALVKLNGIKDANKINVGQVIKLK